MAQRRRSARSAQKEIEMSQPQIDMAMNKILTTMREWANRDSWLTFTPNADEILHDQDCVLLGGADVRDYICGCQQCLTCGAQAICAGCHRADAVRLGILNTRGYSY